MKIINSIYEKYFDSPVDEFSDELKEKFRNVIRDDEVVDAREWEDIKRLLDVLKFQPPTNKEITDDDIKEVFKENSYNIGEIIYLVDGGKYLTETFERRYWAANILNGICVSDSPNKKNCQFNFYLRYFYDFCYDYAFWRKSYAITGAYAKQLTKKVGSNGVESMLKNLKMQIHEIEKLSETVSDLVESVYKSELQITETDEETDEIILSPKNSLKLHQISKINSEFVTLKLISYEELYLLDMAKKFAEDEERSKLFKREEFTPISPNF